MKHNVNEQFHSPFKSYEKGHPSDKDGRKGPMACFENYLFLCDYYTKSDGVLVIESLSSMTFHNALQFIL